MLNVVENEKKLPKKDDLRVFCEDTIQFIKSIPRSKKEFLRTEEKAEALGKLLAELVNAVRSGRNEEAEKAWVKLFKEMKAQVIGETLAYAFVYAYYRILKLNRRFLMEKCGLPKATYYRWIKELSWVMDPEFKDLRKAIDHIAYFWSFPVLTVTAKERYSMEELEKAVFMEQSQR